MTRLYFHCSNAQDTWVDPTGAELRNLAEADLHARRLVRVLIAEPTLEDWRDWTMHVLDEDDEPVFSLPFAAALGRPH
ncbi:MAG: hypothetical protein KF889_19470 [Alphaproteobacteria bacterium]|nr:hypothetical protein [Alphaproteobacteria bacterium]MCW5744043.1 hypothetical protein [Alphaproteobacteria bacterium]